MPGCIYVSVLVGHASHDTQSQQATRHAVLEDLHLQCALQTDSILLQNSAISSVLYCMLQM